MRKRFRAESFRGPHDVVPSVDKAGGGGWTSDVFACRWALVEAPASRVMRGHQVAFGNRRRDPSTWVDRKFGAMSATG
jgi:hypothetical protein